MNSSRPDARLLAERGSTDDAHRLNKYLANLDRDRHAVAARQPGVVRSGQPQAAGPVRRQKDAVTLATTAASAIDPFPSPPVLKLG